MKIAIRCLFLLLLISCTRADFGYKEMHLVCYNKEGDVILDRRWVGLSNYSYCQKRFSMYGYLKYKRCLERGKDGRLISVKYDDVIIDTSKSDCIIKDDTK